MSEEIERALEIVRKRASMPGIEPKEKMLRLLDFMQLNNLLTKEQALEDMIKQEELALMESKSLGKGSKEDIEEWKKQIERHKARLRKTVEEDKEKVRKILEDAKLD